MEPELRNLPEGSFMTVQGISNPTIGVPTALVRFIVALMLKMITNALLLEFFIGIKMGVWAAQVLSTVVLTASNLIIYRLWVFR